MTTPDTDWQDGLLYIACDLPNDSRAYVYKSEGDANQWVSPQSRPESWNWMTTRVVEVIELTPEVERAIRMHGELVEALERWSKRDLCDAEETPDRASHSSDCLGCEIQALLARANSQGGKS